MKWKEVFRIVPKPRGFIIVKHGDVWSYNFKMYPREVDAKRAAAHIYNGMQRKIEKLLLG